MRFGVPYGEEAIAWASSSRVNLNEAPPPEFEEVEGARTQSRQKGSGEGEGGERGGDVPDDERGVAADLVEPDGEGVRGGGGEGEGVACARDARGEGGGGAGGGGSALTPPARARPCPDIRRNRCADGPPPRHRQ